MPQIERRNANTSGDAATLQLVSNPVSTKVWAVPSQRVVIGLSVRLIHVEDGEIPTDGCIDKLDPVSDADSS